MYLPDLVGLIIPLIITIVIFLVCRELVCWYWKQNEQVALLKEIRDLLKQIAEPLPMADKKID